MWSDSPAKSDLVKQELEDFRKVLRKEHIRSHYKATESGNLFMVKVWVVVAPKDFTMAKNLADTYLEETKHHTRHIHNAE